MKKSFFGNPWTRIGLGWVLLGWTPVAAILLLAALGLWPDPDPNPLGPGLLFFVTLWPALVCFAVGTVQTWRK